MTNICYKKIAIDAKKQERDNKKKMIDNIKNKKTNKVAHLKTNFKNNN